MTDRRYSAESITVMSLDESVRLRTAMYFRIGRDDPSLPTRILSELIFHALHPDSKIAGSHEPVVTVEITADLAFTITDDQAVPGSPALGYHDSLLTPARFGAAAAASLCSRVTVEVWRDGLGFRQELSGLRPHHPPAEFTPPPGTGTRIAFALDPALLTPEAAITTDLATLETHSPNCSLPPATLHLTDRRQPSR